MRTYIEKPKIINISQVKEKKSLSSFSYRKICFKNYNIVLLKNLLKENKKWFEPWSDNYVNFGKNYFVRITEMDVLNNTFTISEKTNKIIAFEWKNFIENWDICFQTASNVWNVNFYFWPKAYFNSHIRKISFDKKYYIFSILKSSFWKNQVDIWGSIKWVDNFNNKLLENIKIPFPSKNNHQEPEKIENLVSLITQNIIDKEEQIKLKNKIIDEKIEKELRENQISWKYEYCFPTISWIRETSRLDTWLYWQKFKEFYSLVENYKYWYWNIEELWFKTKKWPNLAISVIWTSIYSDEKINKNFKKLILSKDVTEEWWIKNIKYIWNKKNLPTLKQYDFMLFARWDIGRVLFIDDSLVWATSNFDVFFITSKLPYFKNIFLLNYFKFLKTHNFWEYFWVWGSWAPSLTDYFLKKLKIPNFPEEKQQEIASLYYNKVEKNIDLTFENYLEKEKKRNSELWIFQLNMELFELRETLENLIDKIIMDKEINIDFWY